MPLPTTLFAYLIPDIYLRLLRLRYDDDALIFYSVGNLVNLYVEVCEAIF